MNSERVQCNGKTVFAALLPHAPVLIPGVAGRRMDQALASVTAMREIGLRLRKRSPEAVVLISPHSPRRSMAFGVWSGERLHGSLGPFGAPHVEVDLPNDRGLAGAIAWQAMELGLTTWEIPPSPLDHGAVVPLWHLADAGWKGPTVVLSLNHPGEGGLVELGLAISRAAVRLGRRVGVVASGDMSHRLKPNAPSGFDPRATLFDRAFMETIGRGAYRDVMKLDPELQELAAEDVVDSTVVAASSVDWNTAGHEVMSYEGPFGVGYGVAVLFDPNPGHAASGDASGVADGKVLPGIARASLRAAISGAPDRPPCAEGRYLTQRCGVFVTIRDRAGELRGCVGTTSSKCGDVVAETWRLAREAAFRDSRFPRVRAEELPHLQFDVSVLGPVEDVASAESLDARRYGVIVSTDDGRRGMLLPNLPDVPTVEEQLDIARRKGCIAAWETVRLQRFETDKFSESHGDGHGEEL